MTYLMFLAVEALFFGIISLFVTVNASLDPATDNYYYSSNVTEATSKFTAACSSAGGSIEYFNHSDRGAYGEQLQAAVCAQGNPRARSIVYTISGTHGVEGYAGSMVQISMLHMPSSDLLADIRMVHLHMINPYGAYYTSKENEQNADQLKNEAMYYSLDYDNPILQQLIDAIDLPKLGNATVQQSAFAVFGQLIAQYGEDTVNLALKTGQGKRPQGISYFGPSKSWSSETTEYVVNKYLQNADNILLIDWHTAVGLYGNWTYLPLDNESMTAFESWIPNAPTDAYDVGVPTGGKLPYTMIKEKTGAKRFIRVVWEAGTYPVTQQTNAMFILRLYCRFYSNTTDPFCQQIIANTREYFYPQADDWKELTYKSINELLPEVLSGFAAEINSAATLMMSGFYIAAGLIVVLHLY